MKKLFPLTLFPILSSCATYQLRPSDSATNNFFVFREGYNSSATRMRVFVDGKLAGKMLGYRYLSFSLPPGPHEVYFKFNPLVSRSVKLSFVITPEENKVFIVKKTLLGYGLKIREEKDLPAEFEQEWKPQVRAKQ